MVDDRAGSIYDRVKEHLDAKSLVGRLDIEVVREVGSEIHCRPLCHESESGESLHINAHTGRWVCRACQPSGVYGDLIQLVEYVQTGGQPPAHGREQGNSATHREAIRWLCDQYGIPFSERTRVSDPEVEMVHTFAMAAHRHLLHSPEVLRWIEEKWGFDGDTVAAYGLGFMPSPILPEIAAAAAEHAGKSIFAASGVGFYRDGKFVTRFEGRITFPYLEHGRTVYLIGRATPWTPPIDGARAAPKYHKLTVHSEQRPHISKRITNDHLYNETVMANSDRVVIAEGVADAVALSSLGVPVVSPVTISFNKTDQERFIEKAKAQGIRHVEILFDNELSGSGEDGARRTARKLVEHGLSASILTLPLGDSQEAARGEVLAALGDEAFAELESADPRRRKEIISEWEFFDAKRDWLIDQVNASKIDAAEWCAMEGAAAPGKFNRIRRDGVDVIDGEIDAVEVESVDADFYERIEPFALCIDLAAHVDERALRAGYAGRISKRIGRGIDKPTILSKINQRRKDITAARRDAQKEAKVEERSSAPALVPLPPDPRHAQPEGPAPLTSAPDPNDHRPPGPPPPSELSQETELERYASVRANVEASVGKKVSEEVVGEYVASTIVKSMGYTPFRTADELYLVRGNQRIPVGLGSFSAEVKSLFNLVAGLLWNKSAHRSYMEMTRFFLGQQARRVEAVSWSHVDGDAVFFPTGDKSGQMLRIAPGKLDRTRMADARVPAVAGAGFRPYVYTENARGIQAAYDLFRWTSLSEGDRLILIYWIVCLPLLRRIGSIPIVRIEGGSSSGKTRTVDAVSFLVNGGQSSSVPTAAALISRLSTEMLTIDDNREVSGVSREFRGTLLQATNLGAREKRKGNSDTGTVVERVCGALLMNGIEPIHNGKSELASRMLTLRCHADMRADDSPTANDDLMRAVLGVRDAFWSEAVSRCAKALEFDAVHGEHLGLEIEGIFGSTRVGRTSDYTRMAYLCWVAGLPEPAQPAALRAIDPLWSNAFSAVGAVVLDSLLREELAVTAVRYALHWCKTSSEAVLGEPGARQALDGKYILAPDGSEGLGPMRAARLARIVRLAAKDMNAPDALSKSLRAGQLEARIIDGVGFLAEAGIDVKTTKTRNGRILFTFSRSGQRAEDGVEGGVVERIDVPDTWVDPTA